MITRAKAFEFVSSLRDIQDLKHGDDQHTVPEWLIIIRRQLQKAEDAWYQGKQTIALHEIGEATACGIAALEQNGEDLREPAIIPRTTPMLLVALFLAPLVIAALLCWLFPICPKPGQFHLWND